MIKLVKRFVPLFSCLFLAGCAIGPDYQREELNLPEKYNFTETNQGQIVNMPWWQIFKDETLVNLINIALKENKDLVQAMASIDEARAMLGYTRADQFPSLGYSGDFSRIGPSRKTFSGMSPYNDYSLSGLLSFELDVWGRARRATEAKRALLLSSEYGYQTLTISLVASVAEVYITLLDLDERILIAEKTLDSRRDSTKLIRSRFLGGVVPELDVNQAEVEEGDAEVTLAQLIMSRRVTQNALSVLLGRYPHEIKTSASFSRNLILEKLPAGVPADLLMRRPDILAAEEALHAQTALIGVAKASQLPTLSVSGILGLESNRSQDLFNGHAKTWMISPSFTGPLFDFGKSAYQVEAAEAMTRQAKASFEKTVLNAVQEVEDALASIDGYKRAYEAYEKEVVAARNAARLSRARYDDGVTTYLEVLDIERSLFAAELGASSAKKSYVNSLITLYKALGGGWDPERDALSPEEVSEAVKKSEEVKEEVKEVTEENK